MKIVIITSCSGTNVSDFRNRGVNISILNIWSEYMATYKVTIRRTNFREVKNVHELKCTFPKRKYVFFLNMVRKIHALRNNRSRHVVKKRVSSLNCRSEACYTTQSWTLSQVFSKIFRPQMQNKFIRRYRTAFLLNTYLCSTLLCECYYIAERFH